MLVWILEDSPPHPYTTVSLLSSPTRDVMTHRLSKVILAAWGHRRAPAPPTPALFLMYLSCPDCGRLQKGHLRGQNAEFKGAAGPVAAAPPSSQFWGLKRCRDVNLAASPPSPNRPAQVFLPTPHPPLSPHCVCVHSLCPGVCPLFLCQPLPPPTPLPSPTIEPSQEHPSLPPTAAAAAAAAVGLSGWGGGRGLKLPTEAHLARDH